LLERAEVHASIVDECENKAEHATLFDERIESKVVAAKVQELPGATVIPNSY
jgi:hypothetical protein